MRRSPLTAEEQAEVWRRYRAGASLRSSDRALGRQTSTAWASVASTGGLQAAVRRRSPLRLSLAEREELSRGGVAGESCRAIGRRIGRAASTVSRELAGHGGRLRYRACEADQAAWRHARRPRAAKLATHPRLRAIVVAKLKLRWSPQQIAGWLHREHGDEPELQVSHETIYTSLFAQSRGALRKELTRYLRTRRALRRPHATHGSHGGGQLRDPINISAWPAEAADRAVPGHWEGDLLLGRANSTVVTLVKRSSRFVILIRLPRGRGLRTGARGAGPADRHTAAAAAALAHRDRGKEMAQHMRFTVDTGLQIYSCDPRSPWQRGTTENTSGPLRQYFPKYTSLAGVAQRRLDAVAAELNGRPRQTLAWLSPSEKFAEAVR